MATRPVLQLISREEAARRGKTRFFTGKVCKHGHLAERFVSNAGCVRCVNRISTIRIDSQVSPSLQEISLQFSRPIDSAEHNVIGHVLQCHAEKLLELVFAHLSRGNRGAPQFGWAELDAQLAAVAIPKPVESPPAVPIGTMAPLPPLTPEEALEWAEAEALNRPMWTTQQIAEEYDATEKVQGFSIFDLIKAGWTKEQLLEHGYLRKL